MVDVAVVYREEDAYLQGELARVQCRCTDCFISLDNLLVRPGRPLILDDLSPLTFGDDYPQELERKATALMSRAAAIQEWQRR